MSFSSGITGRLRKARVRNGSYSLSTPRLNASFSIFSACFAASVADLSVIRPPTGRGSISSTLPATAMAIPPPQPSRLLEAISISSSLVPITIRLWLSWPIVWAMAPFFSPKPFTSPIPRFPVLWWRSNTASFSMSLSGEAVAIPSFTGTSCQRWCVSSCLGIRPITLAIFSFIGRANCSRLNSGRFTDLLKRVGTGGISMVSQISFIHLPSLATNLPPV